jgi:hypothetical protein
MLCLAQGIQNGLFTSDDFEQCWDHIFPPMKTCLEEDWDSEVRFHTCACFQTLLQNHGASLSFRYKDIYTEMLKRLDDSQDAIRIEICKSFVVMFEVFAGQGYTGNFDFLMKTMFLHLDDNNEAVRAAVDEVMRVAMRIDP